MLTTFKAQCGISICALTAKLCVQLLEGSVGRHWQLRIDC